MNKYLGLLRWSLNHNDGTVNNAKPMDDDRRKWLFEALESQMFDPVDELKLFLETIKMDPALSNYTISQLNDASGGVEGEVQKVGEEDVGDYYARQNDMFEKIKDYVDNIDLAKDFKKLGGLDLLFNLATKSKDMEQKAKVYDVVSVVLQNHPELQHHCLHALKLDPQEGQDGDLEPEKVCGLRLMTRDWEILIQNDIFPSQLVSAVSALVRSHAEATFLFLSKYKGMPLIFETLKRFIAKSDIESEDTNERIRTARKTLFLLKYLLDHWVQLIPVVKDKLSNELSQLSESSDVDIAHLAKEISIICG